MGCAVPGSAPAALWTRLRGQDVVTDAEYRAAVAQLAMLQPGPAPQRPADALHPILRLCDMLTQAPAPTAFRPTTVSSHRSTGRAAHGGTLLRGELCALAQRWRAAGLGDSWATRDQCGAGGGGSDSYGDARGGAIDFTRAIRSPGSTLKPFLYAAALHAACCIRRICWTTGRGGQQASATLTRAISGRCRRARRLRILEMYRRWMCCAAGHRRRLSTCSMHWAARAGRRAGQPGPGDGDRCAATSLDRLADAYAALGDDGMQTRFAMVSRPPEAPPRRVFSIAAAREVGLFPVRSAGPVAEFCSLRQHRNPFAVAMKTGTSQGYRDAWTVAWSREFLVGAWVGRSDAGTMAGLGGTDSAAELVRAVLLALASHSGGELTIPASRCRRATSRRRSARDPRRRRRILAAGHC